MFLTQLNAPVERLTGLGPAAAKALAELGVTTIGRLLQHYPRGYEDRGTRVGLMQSAREDRPACCRVRIVSQAWFGFKPKETLKLHVEDEFGQMGTLVCFNRPFLAKSHPPGQSLWVYGSFQSRYGEIQAAAFELGADHEGRPPSGWGGLLPLYPLGGSLTQPGLRKAVHQALKDWAAPLQDDLPPRWADREGFTSLASALKAIHEPKDEDEARRARRWLAARELFHLQATLRQRRLSQAAAGRPPLALKRGLSSELLARLPFQLTPDQQRVISEIETDLAGPRPMARLLQGDVGSGKTLVAWMSVLPVIEAGFQAALLAPTELLALQHAENAAKLLEPLGVRVSFLSGKVGARGRAQILAALAGGYIDLVVGTHALFSADVVYKNLRLVIVDEQHRFGVEQRKALHEKGGVPDLLLMSATPIPRTLAQTAFGDLEVSVLRHLPPGRQPIATHLARQSNLQKVLDFVAKELAAGRQAYFVYPLIGTSDALDLKDAQSAADQLTAAFPQYRVGLVHSQVDEESKKDLMDEFRRGRVHILVATSVVEVGVDVPNATCMVIEHAERFGLSALHQLRGRVGRGLHQSYCFLVYADNLTEDGKQRLLIMKDTTDGFKIAEEDLRLRGPGDLAGVRQSGYLKLAAADLGADVALLEEAREAVKTLFEADPGLLRPEHQALRRVLAEAPLFSPELIVQG